MQAVTRTELAEIIGEKTLEVSDPKKLAREVAAFLMSLDRPVDLNSLLRDVMQYRLSRGVVEAMAVSAHELTPAVIQDVESLLRERFPAAKSVRIDTRLDENLVGGVRVELPRETLDLSVRNKLNTFKRLVAEGEN